MKFKSFLTDIDNFRNLKLGLVKGTSNNEEISKILEDFELSDDIIKEKERLNIELKKVYTGKFKFDFCLLEDINIKKLKIKRQEKHKQLFEEFIKLNSVLGKTQTELERKLSEEAKK